MNLRVALPPKVRAVLYYIFSIVGLTLGALWIGFSAAETAQPTWLTVALAVFAFLAPALGVTAASNTPTSARPEIGLTRDQVPPPL